MSLVSSWDSRLSSHAVPAAAAHAETLGLAPALQSQEASVEGAAGVFQGQKEVPEVHLQAYATGVDHTEADRWDYKTADVGSRTEEEHAVAVDHHIADLDLDHNLDLV